MENEFKRAMSKKTDEELVKVVTINRAGYKAIAIEAAELEIEKRGIDSNEFEEIKEKATIQKEQIQKVDSNVVGSGTRFLNFVIDFIVWLIITIVLTFPLNVNSPNHKLIGYLILVITFVGYYCLMEMKFQKTVGKFVTKTKVVKMNGEKPESSDIIARSFYRLIPFDRVSFLFTKNGIHDYLSNTKVIKDQEE